MIIIKTKTGDIFVNDKEMVNVTHNRELHTVDIHDGKGMGTLWRKPPIEHIGRIEKGELVSVAYVTIQQIAEALGMTVDITDPGLQDLAPLKRMTP